MENIHVKPTVILLAAMTMDGKIAQHGNHSTDWTSPEDKKFLHTKLDESNVIIVGSKTYATAIRPLSKRNCIVWTRSVEDSKQEGKNLLYYNPSGPTPIENVIAPYQNIALLGGAQTYTYFLERNLIDELYLTIEPIVFGGGLGLFEGNATMPINFQFISVRELNDKGTLLLHYQKKVTV